MSNKLAVPATNVPRCGTITGVSFAASNQPNWDDQIRIDGMWEREGPGHFYQSIQVAQAYTDVGVIRQEGFSSDGRPLFAVVNPAQRVMILRKEVPGSRAKATEVTAIDVQGNRIVLEACAKPVLPQKPATPTAAPAAPVAPPVQSAPAPPTQAAPAPVSPPSASGRRQVSDHERKEEERARWAELDEHYGACLAIAAYRLREALGPDVDHAVIQAGAATVMIQSERQALSALPGLAKQLRERLNGRKAEGAHDPGLTEQEARGTRAPANARRVPSGEDEYGDYPENLDEADDDLPF